MTRQTIDYGIDLGTTNSSIARIDNGKLTEFIHEPSKNPILPSCVHFTKSGQMYVGDQAYGKLHFGKESRENTFEDFKRNMGYNVEYLSSHTGRKYTPEELSAEVLKKLKLSVKDEEVSCAVITVPAAFDQVQIEATKRAAKIAGFEYCELLQEPIAAAMGYSIDKRMKDGTWLVFDLGGGTFDVALVRMEDGIMKVVDHAGNNHLGGKDMDWLIVDEIIIPQIKKKYPISNILGDEDQRLDLRDIWKPLAEGAKIDLSERPECIIEPYGHICKDDDGNEIDMPIVLSRVEFEKLISPLIDKAINFSKDLLERNKLMPKDLITILMVGGPTNIPLLKSKIKNELYENIDISDPKLPMLAVARGAAFYAATKPIPEVKQKRDLSKVQLTLAYPTTTAELAVTLGIRVEKDKSGAEVPKQIFAEISRVDKTWTTGKIELQDGVGVVRLNLKENLTNGFLIQLFNEIGNKVECEPNTISILQGVRIAAPPLPHDIGVSAVVWSAGGEEHEQLMVPLIKKGTPLPTAGQGRFKCAKDIRPGNRSDVIQVIVWEGKGRTIDYRNRHVGILEITGDKLSSLLPEGSELEITIKLDESRRASVSVYLPYLDETIDEAMDPDYKRRTIPAHELSMQIGREKNRLSDIHEKSQEVTNIDDELNSIDIELNELDELNKRGCGDEDTSHAVENRIQEIAIKLDKIQESVKWPQIENELNAELKESGQVVEKYGDEKDEKFLSQIKVEYGKVIKKKDIKSANYVLKKLQTFKWDILFNQKPFWVSTLQNILDNFEAIKWRDRSKARSLVEEGSEILASGQYTDEIEDIVRKLWQLMEKEGDIDKTKKPRKDIPWY